MRESDDKGEEEGVTAGLGVRMQLRLRTTVRLMVKEGDGTHLFDEVWGRCHDRAPNRANQCKPVQTTIIVCASVSVNTRRHNQAREFALGRQDVYACK